MTTTPTLTACSLRMSAKQNDLFCWLSEKKGEDTHISTPRKRFSTEMNVVFFQGEEAMTSQYVQRVTVFAPSLYRPGAALPEVLRFKRHRLSSRSIYLNFSPKQLGTSSLFLFLIFNKDDL